MTITEQPTNPRAILYRKIAAVTAAMQRVPKNGYNDFHRYKYATESDLTDTIRELLHSNGLAFLPPTVVSYETIETKSKNGTTPMVRVRMRFALACTDTGEVIESELWADGQDAADKGFYKAYTGGVKYFLMKTFLVSTGDDPEQDEQPRPAPIQSQVQRPRLPTEPAQADPEVDKAKARIKAITGTSGFLQLKQWLGDDKLTQPQTTDEWVTLASWVATVQTERAKTTQATA